MKNLIIVTQVGNSFQQLSGYVNEFSLYTNEDEKCYIQINVADINFVIINGKKLIGLEGVRKAIKIIEIINDINNGINNETIIAYHDNVWEDDIKDAFKNLNILKIKKYSTAGSEETSPVYRDYLIVLRQLIKNGNSTERRDELINGLYNFFLGDPSLEAKLELLHSLLVPPAKFEEDYDNWIKLKVAANYNNDSKETIAWKKFVGEDINGKAKDYHGDPFNENYLTALGNLRVTLLGD